MIQYQQSVTRQLKKQNNTRLAAIAAKKQLNCKVDSSIKLRSISQNVDQGNQQYQVLNKLSSTSFIDVRPGPAYFTL